MTQRSTYRADFGMYATWTFVLGIPLWILVLCVVTRPERFPWPGVLEPLLLALSFPSVGAIWLSRYRLVFGDNSHQYRSWSWREQIIPYGTIASVELSKATPVSASPLSTHIRLNDGGYVVVYTKAFSRAAIKRLYSLGSPDGPNKSFKPTPLRGSA